MAFEPFLALAVLVVIFIFMGVKVIPQGFEVTVERFGRYTRTLKPGLSVIVPLVDRVGSRIDMRETVVDVPSQEVITKDNAMVTADGVVFYQVLDAARAAYEVRNLNDAILNLVMTNLRTVMGALDLDELLSQRDRINDKLLTVVDAATSPWGVKITRIEIKDIQPPADLVESMARQMKAERDRRASILEAEGVRAAAILRAEGEKQAAILKAEGQKQSAILEAEARRESAYRDAEAREREAEAEAKATHMVAEAAAGQGVSAINYFLGQKYIEALADFAASPNQKTIFMPLETSGVVGSLGGLAELLKQSGEAQAKQSAGSGSWPR
jgi:regulator of protease activity HflC (stomatin/prohibitin superfamily)